jgi:hypothetical protein
MIRLQSLTNAKFIALLATASMVTSCGFVIPDQKITAAPPSSGASVASADKISPISAKPDQILRVTGKDFSQEAKLKARFTLTDGSFNDVPLKVESTTSASFVMPYGVGLGLKSVKIIQGEGREVATFSLVANIFNNRLPIIIDDESEVCSTKTYIDRNGEQKTGTKNCPQACAADGDSNCVVDGTAYKAAKLSNITASDLLTTKTIAGITGTASPRPANCSSNGQQSCVATGTYFAGTACGADDSNCFLPAFSVPGLQTKKAVDFATIDSSKMLDTLTVSGVTGTIAPKGTWDVTSTFPGAGYYAGVSNTPADSSYTGTLFGTAGKATLESHSNCSSNGATGCVTTSIYKSADLTDLSAGNIKSGVTIAGQLGTYPSVSSPLAGSSGNDLTGATFNAQIKSSATFQYFASDGSRYTGTGDPDIDAAKIMSDVEIFGTTGTAASAVAPDPWDVRVGVTVNGVTGKLKTTCRNRANTSVFDIDQGQAATITKGSPGTININSHGLTNGTMVRVNYSTAPTGLSNGTTYYVVNSAADTFNLSATSGGSAINMTTSAGADVTVHRWKASPTSVDIWDTIDDLYYSQAGLPQIGLPPSVVTDWGNNTDCGGVEVIAGDDNVWKDVTTTAAGESSDCATDGARCTMQDKITGLWWMRKQPGSVWNVAWSNCQSLNHNGQTGWRLPTQKELMEAYTHGIRSAASTNWITGDMDYQVWSGSSYGSTFTFAWTVNLASGYTYSLAHKISPEQVVCVR